MEKFVDQAQFIEACQELKSSLAKLGDIIDKLPEKDFEKNFQKPPDCMCRFCCEARQRKLAEELCQHLQDKHDWNGSNRVAQSAIDFLREHKEEL